MLRISKSDIITQQAENGVGCVEQACLENAKNYRALILPPPFDPQNIQQPFLISHFGLKMPEEKSTEQQLKRIKVTLACVICRRKKVKCDGAQPSCSRCMFAGVACQYSDFPRKRGPPKANVEVIENRVHRIESLLCKEKVEKVRNINGKSEFHVKVLHEVEVMRVDGVNRRLTTKKSLSFYNSVKFWHDSGLTTNVPTNPHRECSLASYGELLTKPDELVDMNRSGPIDAGRRTRTQTNYPSMNAFFDLIANSAGQSRFIHNSGALPSTNLTRPLAETMLISRNIELGHSVDRELSDHLVNCFFLHFNLVFPILSRPHFMHQIQNGPASIDPLLLNAVYATGSRYSGLAYKDFSQPETAGQMFFDRCQDYLMTQLNQPTVSTVQGLVILCWYLYLVGDAHKCNVYQGIAMRHMFDLNMLCDPEHIDPNMDIVETEMRRRCFWVLFVNDRWTTTTTRKNYSIDERENNCKRPRLEDRELWELTMHNLPREHTPVLSWDDSDSESIGSVLTPGVYSQNEGEQQTHVPSGTTGDRDTSIQIRIFGEMITLTCIIGKINVNLYASPAYACNPSVFSSLESSLTQWLLNLPPCMQYDNPVDNRPPSPISRLYHMFYYTVQIMLHRFNVIRHGDSSVDGSSTSPTSHAHQMSLNICMQAANTITHIAGQMLNYGQNRYVFNAFMFSLTASTTIHWSNSLSDNPQLSVPAHINLNKSVKVLKDCNLTMLSTRDLAQIIDEFLGRYPINFEDEICVLDSKNNVEGNIGNKRAFEDLDTSARQPMLKKKRKYPSGNAEAPIGILGEVATQPVEQQQSFWHPNLVSDQSGADPQPSFLVRSNMQPSYSVPPSSPYSNDSGSIEGINDLLDNTSFFQFFSPSAPTNFPSHAVPISPIEPVDHLLLHQPFYDRTPEIPSRFYPSPPPSEPMIVKRHLLRSATALGPPAIIMPPPSIATPLPSPIDQICSDLFAVSPTPIWLTSSVTPGNGVESRGRTEPGNDGYVWWR
ncbi:fungal-specific transcription factor domain-containing protein [Jimgerdemannia flammicorona]|uniref:Fungal-specific transcription factor domain-containing protein n=1 Tax=Jimgerdemannia flammicorona TaxID=994334 RepID=A0A433QBB2_9FUNG|nr:fungal-specific transcription factor domain-containing protein [Jimgerdemannia flammicorona]